MYGMTKEHPINAIFKGKISKVTDLKIQYTHTHTSTQHSSNGFHVILSSKNGFLFIHRLRYKRTSFLWFS